MNELCADERSETKSFAHTIEADGCEALLKHQVDWLDVIYEFEITSDGNVYPVSIQLIEAGLEGSNGVGPVINRSQAPFLFSQLELIAQQEAGTLVDEDDELILTLNEWN